MNKIVYISETAEYAADLVLDVGNSSFRLATCDNGKVIDRFDCAFLEDPDFIKKFIGKLKHFRKTAVVRAIAVASVAPKEAAAFFIKLVQEPFPLAPVTVISGDMKNLPVKFAPGFTQKNKIGADAIHAMLKPIYK